MASNNPRPEPELVSYVHDVSPLKKARKSNIDYFNFKAQTEKTVHQGVSFNKDFRDTMVEASSSKSPVKLKNYKCKANYFDNTKTDIQLDRKSHVATLSSAEFKHQKQSNPNANIMTCQKILAEGYDSKIVSVVGYVCLDSCYATRTNDSSRIDVYFNDDSGSIPLTIWNPEVRGVINGVYDIFNLAVRQITIAGGTQLILSTTESTVFKQSKSNVQKKAAEYKLSEVLSFPIESCFKSGTSIRCNKSTCRKLFSIDISGAKTNHYKCPCGNRVKFTAKNTVRCYKIMLDDDREVTIFQNQLDDYISKMK
eukprot:TCONS_00037086-protein